ncbi:MAG: type II secretion system ATPase GspE [Fusobacteria bacterium]|nr:type II secretion system ATPase GspE [Fusobacteriota bacterium]
MAKHMKKRLGDSLIDSGFLSEEQLKIALAEQKKAGEKLGETVVRLGYCTNEQIIEVLGEQMGIPFVRLDRTVIDSDVIELISKDIANKYKVIPLFKVENVLNLAMADPLDIFVIDEIEFQTGLEISQMIATEEDIDEAISKYYGETQSKKSDMSKYKDDNDKKVKSNKIDITVVEDSSPAIEIVNLILKQAIEDKASDIHIESEEEELRVRFRIDGVLHEVMQPPKNLESPIVSRIKIMAKLDIAERRIPQDGRIELKYEKKDIDLRVSTLPTVYGEKVVMRILDKSNVTISMQNLGFSDDFLNAFRRLIKKPNGILLVTGPTGSGKTSTLYAALNEINTLDKNIITLEDPVEYQLKIINQVQINPGVGLNFASGLRSILRQDPDVIMLGEIRDRETAEIAIEAAMTGHLVFSTLHTNSAAGAVARLIDMGVEPFLISSSLIGVIGQRLVRRICNNCKKEISPDQTTIEELNIYLNNDDKFYQGEGCKVCKKTGYKGRTGVNEILVPDDNIRRLINERASATDIKNVAEKLGMVSMRKDGLNKVKKGVTTLEEVLRATQEDI